MKHPRTPCASRPDGQLVERAVEQAFNQVRSAERASWPDELRVAVNVSAIQFQQPGLEESVRSALAAAGLAPHRLELEITESVLV